MKDRGEYGPFHDDEVYLCWFLLFLYVFDEIKHV